jgi:cytochrome c-type biogenesis protein
LISELILIFLAGMLALFSPCSFPMLPGYISYYLGAKISLKRAIFGGIVCILGLFIVFSIIGLIVFIFHIFIISSFLGFIAGIIIIFMGISMIIEIKFPKFFIISRTPRQKGLIGLFLYGIAYGLATFGCSAPISLSIIFYSIATNSPLYGIIAFIIYTIGMGIPIIIITILIAKTKNLIIKRVMKIIPRLQKISGIVLIIIGSYLIYSYYVSYNLI